MPDLELELLLRPLDVAAPCGADLEYDEKFLALQQLAAGKPERQYGDTIIPAEWPDWTVVHEEALGLAQRTRDLRIAVQLARSGARVRGLSGAVFGLQLVAELLARYWGHVHPLLDASDNNDPTARFSALLPLVHGAAALADFRAAALTPAKGSLTVRDIELALGHAKVMPGETSPTEEGVLQGVTEAVGQYPDLAPLMLAGLDSIDRIVNTIEANIGAKQAPDFGPLRELFQPVAEAAQRMQSPQTVHAAVGQAGAPAAALGEKPAVGVITCREDVVRTLQTVCDWIERNEPSNPAPLLIRRAQRLMSKNFLEIMRDLVPDGLGTVERIAGTSN